MSMPVLQWREPILFVSQYLQTGIIFGIYWCSLATIGVLHDYLKLLKLLDKLVPKYTPTGPPHMPDWQVDLLRT